MLKNILFVQPFITQEMVLSDNLLKDQIFKNTLIWPVYLENFLKSKDHSINSDLLYLPIEKENGNITINSLKEVELFYSQMNKLIAKLNFEINIHTLICISVPSSFHYLSSILVANYFKLFHPNSVLVVGGVHTIACPDDFKYQNSPVDYLIRGEGELPLYELIKKEGKKQKNPAILESKIISNLDDLPSLDYSIFKKYSKSLFQLNLNLSRGCPYKCSFCMEQNISLLHKKKQYWRSYSPNRAVQEIENLINFGQDYCNKPFSITINDPIFGLNKKWLEKFLSIYNVELDALWIESRIDVLNEAILRILYKKNFFQMYGLESCSMKMLEIMNKTKNPINYLHKIKRLFKIHEKLDYLCIVNILLNHPGETGQTIQESLDNFKEIIYNLKFSNFILGQYLYCHYPDTEVYNNFQSYAQKYGSVSYFPEWWKNEKNYYGAYCVRSSKELPLERSLDLYSKFYKEIETLKVSNLNKKNEILINLIKINKLKEKILDMINN